ncbi:autophagy associated protein Atg9 [Schizosaccharomyces japonicus yFS275]|uniref:Autophagy-related protein 9 n=1 Tax=Schizosaccharomyces japonicus (strain yFS275 / FY16936) TaxID=402676 RepID=B6K3B6_SCHJY|nr:autophagy associated protein Atg9 [Schizosaccharomyces japonicus yFS275]EEB07973.1 autophagy associated protein Atg9 [Schizosaccharomyces japonicus yFS275]
MFSSSFKNSQVNSQTYDLEAQTATQSLENDDTSKRVDEAVPLSSFASTPSRSRSKIPKTASSAVSDSTISSRASVSANSDDLLVEGPPPSLLLEEGLRAGSIRQTTSRSQHRLQNSAASRLRLPRNRFSRRFLRGSRSGRIDPEERALWYWANVENMDVFLNEIYAYYQGKGFWCIILHRFLQVSTIAFVVGFSTYLTSCVNWQSIKPNSSLASVIYPRCMARMSSTSVLILWVLLCTLFALTLHYTVDTFRLWRMRDFFVYALHIPEQDMQTVSWPLVVQRLMMLKDLNALTAPQYVLAENEKRRMDAHAIVNRIMRKENYMIALMNNGILEANVPYINSPIFTKTMEWNLSWCILSHVFGKQGQVKQEILSFGARTRLAEELRRRFIVAAVLNGIFAPFIAIYLVLLYFFRYFNEYHKNPSSLGARRYTPLAQWRFREFNELQHVFEKRMNASYEAASHYISQFPNINLIRLAKFVTLVLGSFTAILVLLTIIEPDLALTFELTDDRPILFYLGIFGTLIAVVRSAIPEDTLVFDPEASLKEVVEYTHYLPASWKDKMHSKEVQAEFCAFYAFRVTTLLWEIIGVLYTPFFLWKIAPERSAAVIDFFREHTVNVSGVGNVCSFAVFHSSTRGPATSKARETFTRTSYPSPMSHKVAAVYGASAGPQARDAFLRDKMQLSILNFAATNPEWIPQNEQDVD